MEKPEQGSRLTVDKVCLQLTALVRLETVPSSEKLKASMQTVFNALHNHHWYVMGPQPASELDKALGELAQTMQEQPTGAEY
jgi:DNA-binding ferritin-like protein